MQLVEIPRYAQRVDYIVGLEFVVNKCVQYGDISAGADIVSELLAVVRNNGKWRLHFRRNGMGIAVCIYAVVVAFYCYHLSVDSIKSAQPEIAIMSQIRKRNLSFVHAGQQRVDGPNLIEHFVEFCLSAFHLRALLGHQFNADLVSIITFSISSGQ